MSHVNGIQRWVVRSRAWALTATFIPIGLGSLRAYKDGAFSWLLFALIFVCGCLLQVTVNFLNTYVDGVKGVDDERTERSKCPKELALLKRAACVTLGLALMLTAGIIYLSTWKLLYFAVAGILGTVFYTSRFFKYAGGGVPGVFVLMGLLEPMAAYYAQTQRLSWVLLMLSLPVACLVAAILHGNDLRDMKSDAACGISTFALLLGERRAWVTYVVLITAPFVLVAASVAILPSLWPTLLTFLLLPLAGKLAIGAARHAPGAYEKEGGRLHFLFGMLLLIGLLFAP